jgi:hypothetical protein
MGHVVATQFHKKEVQVFARRVLGAAIALACVALLCSCSFLSSGQGVLGLQLADSSQQADAQMQHITDAVKHRDASELKALFSKTARAKASNLDSGIRNFLSLFPSGFKNLGDPNGAPDETDESDYGKRTVELFAEYKVLANGKTYDLFFADFSINQDDDPNNVGLYALGVAPWDPNAVTSPTTTTQAFFAWTSQFDIVDHKPTGTPSVYVYSAQK